MDNKIRTFKDNNGLTITVRANPKGCSIVYADYSAERIECEDSTENNFYKAMKYLIGMGLIDEKKAVELSIPIKVGEVDEQD